MSNAILNKERAVVHRTNGHIHGPIRRLMSPSDLGEILKPFVFLDIASFGAQRGRQGFGMHPHSGIATLTFMMTGDVSYEDTTGKKGVLPAGGVEWMRAGSGVWHTGAPIGDQAMSGFQLWVALPASEENAPAESLYLAPADVQHEGPARVLLGQYGSAKSPIPAPADMNYLAVRLKDGERWRYTPPAGHTVAWLAVDAGQLEADGLVGVGELAVFEESEQAIDLVADGETSFVIGSAVKHPHELVMGHYSVHQPGGVGERGGRNPPHWLATAARGAARLKKPPQSLRCPDGDGRFAHRIETDIQESDYLT